MKRLQISKPSPEDEEFPNLASRRLYEYLLADPSHEPFLEKPDRDIYQDYYKTILKPIALEDMWESMAGKGHVRYTLSDMQRDFRRMIANAKRYNRADSLIYQFALTLERVSRKGVKEIEQDGMDDGDEDCLYMKINLRDRKYYEAQQRENAILFEQGVLIVPSVLANAGGVICSYFEWVQNLQQFYWTYERVAQELENYMMRAFQNVTKLAQEKNIGLRQAAYCIALNRVASALIIRGF